MSKNPFLNSLSALVYIVVLTLVMNVGMKTVRQPNSFLAPIAIISLFTLSAAVMGYLFCYQPAQLYFDGKKKAGLSLFLQTVFIFGAMTLCILILLFSGLLPRG